MLQDVHVSRTTNLSLHNPHVVNSTVGSFMSSIYFHYYGT